MTCPSDIIFHDSNRGTDFEPTLETRVACDLDPRHGGCGFDVPFIDEDGDTFTPHDWWVTSADFRRYEVLHQQHAASQETADTRCPDCRHSWASHDQLLAGTGKIMLPEYNPYHVPDSYECNTYAGMGNWCGCRNRSRLSYVPEGPDGALVPLPYEESS